MSFNVMFKGFRNMNADEANDFYERIEGLMNKFNNESPNGINKGF